MKLYWIFFIGFILVKSEFFDGQFVTVSPCWEGYGDQGFFWIFYHDKTIRLARDTTMCLEIKNDSYYPDQLDIWKCNSGKNQYWTASSLEYGIISIKSDWNGKCLQYNEQDNTVQTGSLLQVTECNVNLRNQKFQLVNNSIWKDIEITTLDLGFCVHVGVTYPSSDGDIYSGESWYDVEGNKIEAHGAGFFYSNKKFYWFGETKKTENLITHGINCYSSNNLLDWKFEGQSLYQENITNIPNPGPYVIERPKVVYNKISNLYVMWFHLDNSNYSLGLVGIATSSTIEGPFKFIKGFKPDNLMSYDMSLFEDDDGLVYFVRSVQNKYVGISRLSPDFMETTGIISSIPVPREGQAIFKKNETYYLVGSHLTGWAPNAMELFTTKTLFGDNWKSLGNPSGSPITYNSQSAYVLPVNQNGETLFIFIADRWNFYGPGGLLNASYVWLPIQFIDNEIIINWMDFWKFTDF